MKSLYLLFIFGLINTLQAQYKFTTPIIEDRSVTTSSERYTNETEYLPDDVIGSPYLDEAFLLGKLYENNELLSKSHYFRYNATEDDIEVKENLSNDDSKIMILEKNPNIYVKVAGNILVFDEKSNGYHQVLFLGNNYNLYKKLTKKLQPAQHARNSFERDILAKYKEDFKYYLVDKDGVFKEIPSKRKKRINFFGNKKTEIETYVSKYELDIMDEHILIKIIRYFDSFKDANLI